MRGNACGDRDLDLRHRESPRDHDFAANLIVDGPGLCLEESSGRLSRMPRDGFAIELSRWRATIVLGLLSRALQTFSIYCPAASKKEKQRQRCKAAVVAREEAPLSSLHVLLEFLHWRSVNERK